MEYHYKISKYWSFRLSTVTFFFCEVFGKTKLDTLYLRENHKTRLGKPPRPILFSKRKKKRTYKWCSCIVGFTAILIYLIFENESSEISRHACVWKSVKHTLVIVVVVAADNGRKNYIDWRKQTDKQSFRQSYTFLSETT